VDFGHRPARHPDTARDFEADRAARSPVPSGIRPGGDTEGDQEDTQRVDVRHRFTCAKGALGVAWPGVGSW
jgi:hypothetical protein